MQLTYATHTKAVIQAVLSTGETLPGLEGPGVFYVPVTGDNAAYAEIVTKEMVINDPLDSAPVTAAIEEVVAKQKAEAEATAQPAEAPAAAAEPAPAKA